MSKGMVHAGSRKRVQVTDTVSGQISEVEARCVVNAAGLHAQEVALRLHVPKDSVPKRYLAKGNYFTLAGKVALSLVYAGSVVDAPPPSARGNLSGGHTTLIWCNRQGTIPTSHLSYAK